jgi:hypothetical protein
MTSFRVSPAPHKRAFIKNAWYRHKSSDDLCLYEVFFYKCFHVWSGRCTKIDVLVPNWQTFRTKIQHFTQNSLPCARASNNKQQNRNRCPPHRLCWRSFWPSTTTNQQFRGTSLTSKMIANSPYDFIMVDCYLAAFFSKLVKLPHHGLWVYPLLANDGYDWVTTLVL